MLWRRWREIRIQTQVLLKLRWFSLSFDVASSPHSLAESEEFGPVFIQEPDDVIYPLDADEKRVVMHCEARGNPPPTYRWQNVFRLQFAHPADGVRIRLEQNKIMSHSFRVSRSWYVNRTEIDPLSDYRYSLVDGNLVIANGSVISDYGMYQCRADNSFGAVFSREALLQFACEWQKNKNWHTVAAILLHRECR